MHVLPLALAGLLAASPRAIEPQQTCEALRADKRFKVLFQNVEIDKLVQAVADATCRTFIVPDNIKGKISIVGPESGLGEIDGEHFYAAFLAALDANGLTVVRSGTFFRIIDKSRADKSPIETTVDPNEVHRTNDEMVTRLFKLRYAELEPIKAVLTQLISPGAEMVSYAPDTLILTEMGSHLPRLEKLVASLDVAPAADQLKVIPIKFASAQDVADKLQRLLDKGHGAPPKPGTSLNLLVVADERTNKLVVSASPATIDRILQLLVELDVALPGDGQLSVCPLKNADAKDVATTLEPLLGGARTKQVGPNGAQTAPLFLGEVKVSASEATNGLVVVASPADYRNLSRLIEQLDQPRKQVFIEAAILEVDLERDSDLGVSWHGVASASGLPVVFGSNLPGEASSLSLANLLSESGALAGIQGPILQNLSTALGVKIPQFGLLLHALQQSSDVNVISTPHILAMDNKEAVIHVGEKVPFQTGYSPSAVQQAASSGATAVVSSIQQLYAPITRENVELKLTVKPHVGEGDEVRLEIDEQTEEVTSSDKVLGPTTSTRGTKTSVVGQDHRTIVLGGIMEDRSHDTVAKIPILGDIPILGNLFRTTTKVKKKTNLLLFLTPHIIRTRSDFDAISRRKSAERQKMLEEFWGERGVEPPVDFGHKPGPLAAMASAIAHESNRPENGGPGNPGEHLVAPAPPETPKAQPL